jgi:hypothetical protein
MRTIRRDDAGPESEKLLTVFLRRPLRPANACGPEEQSVTTRTAPCAESMRDRCIRQAKDDMAEHTATTAHPARRPEQAHPARRPEQARLVLRERPAAHGPVPSR